MAGTRVMLPDSLGSILATMRAQQSAQASTPTLDHSTIRDGATTVIDGNNEPRVIFGLYEWPHGANAGASIYGLVALDSSGNPIVVVGQQPDGSYGLGIYDTGGNKQNELNSSGFTAGGVTLTSSGLTAGGVTLTSSGLTAGPVTLTSSGLTAGPVTVDSNGLHVADSGNHERVRAGHLASGDYGLAVTDTAGDTTEVLPAVQQYVAADASVSATNYVSAGGPSVTAVVGASGTVKVEATAQIVSNAPSDGAYAGLVIDGALNRDLLWCFSAGGQTTATCASTVIIPGLAAGSHTFEMQYKHASSTGTADFSQRSLVVTPL